MNKLHWMNGMTERKGWTDPTDNRNRRHKKGYFALFSSNVLVIKPSPGALPDMES